jgi:predicted ABC-type ATPase
MAVPATADAPLLLIVAGPNGSGKSTAYEETLPEFQGRTVWIVNPDRLTKRLNSVETLSGDSANLAAVVRIEEWLYASLSVHQSVGVETVLSTNKYRRLVNRAKELGYEIWLLYVILDHPDRNVERVAIRVRKGGHEVDEADIRRRYDRSLGQLPWFLEEADRAWLYDNSGAELRLVGTKEGDTLELDVEAPKRLINALGVNGAP